LVLDRFSDLAVLFLSILHGMLLLNEAAFHISEHFRFLVIMLKFYYNPISVNARRVWVTLLEKKISFELISD
jgi:hypothetical protein